VNIISRDIITSSISIASMRDLPHWQFDLRNPAAIAWASLEGPPMRAFTPTLLGAAYNDVHTGAPPQQAAVSLPVDAESQAPEPGMSPLALITLGLGLLVTRRVTRIWKRVFR
jgi:hypothetical protein